MKKLIMAMASLVAATGIITAVPPQKAEAAAKPCTQRVLRKGSDNTCVGNVQFMLNLANNANLKFDNKFGPKTKAAVKKWQNKEGIKADGIVGQVTWATLCSERLSTRPAQQVYDQFTDLIGCPVNPPLEDIVAQRRQ